MEDILDVTADDAVKTAKNTIVSICFIVGVIVLIAGIALAVYKYLTPDYLDDFDEFDDDFDDDFFEADQDLPEEAADAVEAAADAVKDAVTA